jgi:hypothetical protein
MFWILIAAIVLVHLHLEYRIWIQHEEDIFAKYRNADTPPLLAAKWAYYAKAIFLLLLVIMQAGGIGFREALVFSFTAYALVLLILLPYKLYNLLNLALAMACLTAWWLDEKNPL